MKYVIVANGDFLDKEIIAECVKDSIIIALDGAANKLAQRGIKPHYILGDFDSIVLSTNKNDNVWGIQNTKDLLNNHDHPYQGNFGVIIVPMKDQTATDLQKAIDFCDYKNASRIDMICAWGGRLDHQESNVRTLKLKYKRERPIYLHNECQTLFFIKDNTVKITGKPKDYCGILAAPHCTFISLNEGLAWSMAGENVPYELKYGVFDSTSNELKKESADITISGDALIVHPPMMESQRKFSSLSKEQQLKKLLKAESFQVIKTTNHALYRFESAYQKVKDRLKLKSDNKILYVSHTKEEILSLFSDAQQQSCLVSMQKDKAEKFLLFSVSGKIIL